MLPPLFKRLGRSNVDALNNEEAVSRVGEDNRRLQVRFQSCQEIFTNLRMMKSMTVDGPGDRAGESGEARTMEPVGRCLRSCVVCVCAHSKGPRKGADKWMKGDEPLGVGVGSDKRPATAVNGEVMQATGQLLLVLPLG